ncbi:hypothetical protein ES703_75834 [subsurface metagenome]
MKISVEWGKPLALRDGSRQNLMYVVDLDKVPDSAGVYVFGRRWGKNIEALYVGKATNIRGRVKGQFNNLRLMQHLKQAKTGKRVLLFGNAITKPGQKIDKVVSLLERVLIRHFLSEGHDLVNRQGARIRRHEVNSDGYQPKKFIPRLMFLEKARGE